MLWELTAGSQRASTYFSRQTQWNKNWTAKINNAVNHPTDQNLKWKTMRNCQGLYIWRGSDKCQTSDMANSIKKQASQHTSQQRELAKQTQNRKKQTSQQASKPIRISQSHHASNQKAHKCQRGRRQGRSLKIKFICLIWFQWNCYNSISWIL